MFKLNSICECFQQIVNQYANNICVQQNENDLSLTYKECLDLVDEFSSILQSKYEVKKGQRIGLRMNSSFEYLISVLTCFKLNLIFVPLDVQHPIDRLNFIIEQANLHLIITNQKKTHSLQLKSIVPMEFNLEIDVLCANECVDDGNGYLIFTSGSTGQPKGVFIDERSLLNTILCQIEIFEIQSSDRIIQNASICFDASLSEMLMSLLTGATLILFDRFDSHSLIDILNRCSITILTVTPSVLAQIDPQQVLTLRTIISVGECCPTALAFKWTNNCSRQFFNGYGPSEAAICTTIYRFNSNDRHYESLPLGQSISNVHLRIVDSQLNDVPLETIGELLIGGIGVSSKGYLQQNQNQSFIHFNEQRWYRTGDFVQIRDEQMNLIYIGRKDNQIQLNGCRIELNEIENVLLSYPGVTLCHVVVHQCHLCQHNCKSLVAYIYNDVDQHQIREYLINKLPSFMIPTYILVNYSFQQTLSNKIDRQSLINDTNVHPPLNQLSLQTDIQKQINDLWSKVLVKQCDQTTTTTTFEQCGGNSLSLDQLRNLIKQQMSIDLPIHKKMTLQQMANLIIEPSTLSDIDTIEQDLQSMLDQFNINPSRSNSSKMETILLTGVTGFLGCFLLNEFLLKTKMKMIVFIRSNSYAEGLHRLESTFIKYQLTIQQQDQQRIQIYFNDDLSSIEWNRIDAIVHCAANTNFNMTYQQLRHDNVLLTKHLLDKCFLFPISFYYISTLSLFLLNDKSMIKESDQPQLKSMIGGYQKTKYVAEQLVSNALKRGVNGMIFRPGRITGSSQSGVGTTEKDLFILMLQGCYQLRAYPNLIFPFDLTPVDKISQSIVQIIQDQQPSTTTSIVHLINQQTIPFDQQFKLLKEFQSFECLSYKEWLNRLEQMSTNPLVSLLSFLQSSFESYAQHWPIFEQTNTSNAMINLCPQTLLQLYSHHWNQIHLFHN